jgi:hypothetical protein
MDHEEALIQATQIASSKNWPWDVTATTVRSWRIWPFPRVWEISSRVVASNYTSLMRINDRSRKMTFGRVIYHATTT